ATWLYKATGEASYLQQAESIYQNRIGGLGSYAQNWDDKSYGVATLLAQETGKQEYKQDVEGWLDSWVNGTNGVQITDGGLRWVGRWGSGRLAASTAFVAGVYADTVGDPAGQYGALVETTIDYLLGDNPRNSSYVVGFGENSPLRPHHRGAGSTPNSSAPNEHILYGALVGGPDQPNDFAYEDDRSNYVTNEVALDYNAGFTGALAYMVDNFGGDPLSNEELNALPGIVVVE
ncbi:MAG: glycoside hydrolase family 9 protein, partial [Cyanobacteria bacterium P01_C01_bin.70]